MGFWSITLNLLKDGGKEKSDFEVHSLISSSDLNSLENNILFDYNLNDNSMKTEDQTTSPNPKVK